MVNTIGTSTFLSDSLLFLRDSLAANVTDPIAAKRNSSSSFVMTSFPQKDAQYPMITIKDNGVSDVQRLGMQSQKTWVSIPAEIKVWGRTVAERDRLSQSVYNYLQQNQFGTGSQTTNFGIHDFALKSMINQDDVDENGKDTGIRAKQIQFSWKAII